MSELMGCSEQRFRQRRPRKKTYFPAFQIFGEETFSKINGANKIMSFKCRLNRIHRRLLLRYLYSRKMGELELAQPVESCEANKYGHAVAECSVWQPFITNLYKAGQCKKGQEVSFFFP